MDFVANDWRVQPGNLRALPLASFGRAAESWMISHVIIAPPFLPGH